MKKRVNLRIEEELLNIIDKYNELNLTSFIMNSIITNLVNDNRLSNEERAVLNFINNEYMS